MGRRQRLKLRTIAANTVIKMICNNGKVKKEEVAEEVVRRLPELSPCLSSDRRRNERFHYNMFDAMALVVAALGRTR